MIEERIVDAQMKAAFDKLFGDMSLSENDVALSIFEYGYKAGMEEALRMIKVQTLAVVVKGKLND